MLTRITAAALFTAASLATVVHAQDVLWTSGPWITDPGLGFDGADASRAESGFPIGLGCNEEAPAPQGPIRITDNFVVSGGPWTLSTLELPAFHSRSSSQFNTNNTFTAAYVVVYDGPPSTGNIIAGDFTTNRMLSSTWSGVYRTSSSTSTTALQNQSRPVMSVVFDMSFVPELADGEYYIVFSLAADPTLGNNIFAFPVHPVADGFDQNSAQFFEGVWIFTPIDYPFTLNGTTGGGCPADWDGSGGIDGDDITAFFVDWQAGTADIDGSGGTDGDDITFFFARWQAGC